MNTPTFTPEEKTGDATAQMVADLLNRQPPQKVDLEGMGFANHSPDVPLEKVEEKKPAIIDTNYDTFSKPQEIIEPEPLQQEVLDV